MLRWVNGKRPDQYGFDFGLWTRQIVQELLLTRFGVRLSLASIGALLARLGLTAQKPLQRADQSDPEAVAKWKNETFPAIATEARASGAEVLFWDESGAQLAHLALEFLDAQLLGPPRTPSTRARSPTR